MALDSQVPSSKESLEEDDGGCYHSPLTECSNLINQLMGAFKGALEETIDSACNPSHAYSLAFNRMRKKRLDNKWLNESHRETILNCLVCLGTGYVLEDGREPATDFSRLTLPLPGEWQLAISRWTMLVKPMQPQKGNVKIYSLGESEQLQSFSIRGAVALVGMSCGDSK